MSSSPRLSYGPVEAEPTLYIFPSTGVKLSYLGASVSSPSGSPVASSSPGVSQWSPTNATCVQNATEFVVLRGAPNNLEVLREFSSLLVYLLAPEAPLASLQNVRIALEFCRMVICTSSTFQSLKYQILNILLNISTVALTNPSATHWMDELQIIVGLEPIINFLIDDDPHITHTSSLILAQLTTFEKFHQELISRDMVPKLLTAMMKDHPVVQANVARCFNHFSWNAESMVHLHREDVQQRLQHLATSADPSARNEARSALKRIRRFTAQRFPKPMVAKLSERDVLDINPVNRHRNQVSPATPTSPHIMPPSLSRLFIPQPAAISETDENDMGESPRSAGSAGSSDSRKASFIKALTVSSITRPDGEIEKRRALIKQVCLSMGDRTTLKKLTDLVTNSFDEKLESMMLGEGVIKSLVSFMGRKEVVIHKIVSALRLFASHSVELSGQILTLGSASLVKFALSDSVKLRHEALACILCLIKTGQHQNLFRSLGLVAGLCHSLFHEKESPILIIGFELLCRLTHSNAESQNEAALHGTVRVILKTLQNNKDSSVHSKALRAASGVTVANGAITIQNLFRNRRSHETRAGKLQNESREIGLTEEVMKIIKTIFDSKLLPATATATLPSAAPLLRNALFALADLVRGNEKSQKLIRSQALVPIIISFLSIRCQSGRSDLGFVERAALSFQTSECHNQWFAASYALESIVFKNSKNQKELKEHQGLLHLLNAISSAKTVLVSTEFAQGQFGNVHTLGALNQLIDQCIVTLIEACSIFESCLAEIVGPAFLDAAKTLLLRKDIYSGVKANFLRLILQAVCRKERWRDIIAAELSDVMSLFYVEVRDPELANLACKVIVAFSGCTKATLTISTEPHSAPRLNRNFGGVPQTA